MEVGGITIPKNMAVMVPIFALHRDPEHWPEPEEFKPDRYDVLERWGSLKNVVLAHGSMSPQIQQAEQGEDQPLHVPALRDRPAQLPGDASRSGDSQTGLGGNVAEIQFLGLQRDRGGNIETISVLLLRQSSVANTF